MTENITRKTAKITGTGKTTITVGTVEKKEIPRIGKFWFRDLGTENTQCVLFFYPRVFR